jgi:hypothetical protein
MAYSELDDNEQAKIAEFGPAIEEAVKAAGCEVARLPRTWRNGALNWDVTPPHGPKYHMCVELKRKRPKRYGIEINKYCEGRPGYVWKIGGCYAGFGPDDLPEALAKIDAQLKELLIPDCPAPVAATE